MFSGGPVQQSAKLLVQGGFVQNLRVPYRQNYLQLDLRLLWILDGQPIGSVNSNCQINNIRNDRGELLLNSVLKIVIIDADYDTMDFPCCPIYSADNAAIVLQWIEMQTILKLLMI